MAVTCHHVVKKYREVLAGNSACFFAIGNRQLNPIPQIVFEDDVLDVCVIRLTPAQSAQAIRDLNDRKTGIGEQFFELGGTPPASPRVGDYVAFAGFPGDLRLLRSFDELNFGVYSSGAARVTDRYTDYIVCQFEREHWVRGIDSGSSSRKALAD